MTDFDFDRRHFLGGSALSLLAASNTAFAQTPSPPAAAPPGKTPDGAIKPSEAIAEFVANFDLKSAPLVAVERARNAFIDTVGVMLAGSKMKASDIVAKMTEFEAGKSMSSVVGRSFRTTPQAAAFADGISSHGMDYDLTYLMGQSTASLVPAILPAAEHLNATANDILAAYIVGFEVDSRIGRGFPQGGPSLGFHSTGTIGCIAAAAAAARLWKVPQAQIPDVIGISVSMAAGAGANFGTMSKPLHAGHAARDGIVATVLGHGGFTGSHTAIEGPGGFYECFVRGQPWTLEPFKDLGHRYDLADRGYKIKRYSCGGLSHTAIDAALDLREALGPRVADIASIKVAVTNSTARAISEPYPHTIEGARFSLVYLIGYALARGMPKLAAFSPDNFADKDIQRLAQLVTVSVDPSFPPAAVDPSPARVTVTLKNGETLERVKQAAIGSTVFPMTEAQIAEKFYDCAAQAMDEPTAKKLYAMLSTLGQKPSLDDLWPLLRIA